MATQLTEHFTLEEMCKSDTAVRKGIDNLTTDETIISYLRSVCAHILEPVRENFGIPFAPTSGYRCPALNAAVNGSSRSQHCKGQAADIELAGVDNFVLADWIESNCTYDQLILEYYKSGEPSSGWVHVSYIQPEVGQNRKNSITFDGNTYPAGLIK